MSKTASKIRRERTTVDSITIAALEAAVNRDPEDQVSVLALRDAHLDNGEPADYALSLAVGVQEEARKFLLARSRAFVNATTKAGRARRREIRRLAGVDELGFNPPIEVFAGWSPPKSEGQRGRWKGKGKWKRYTAQTFKITVGSQWVMSNLVRANEEVPV